MEVVFDLPAGTLAGTGEKQSKFTESGKAKITK